MQNIISVKNIENKIYLIRNQNVMLDSDLADLYDIQTFNLNKAVKRNLKRFPEDFMFQLTNEEWKNLIFQNGISNEGRGGRRTPPYAFTEQGVAMLSSVLNSERAITVNIQIMRTFVKIRKLAITNKDLSQRLDEMEYHFIQYAKEMNINIEDIYKQLDYLKDLTKPAKMRLLHKCRKSDFHTYAVVALGCKQTHGDGQSAGFCDTGRKRRSTS